MNLLKLSFTTTCLLLLFQALVGEGTADAGNNLGLKAVGIGIAILGGGLGIGRIVGSAVESMARQPEMTGTIQTNMLIGAALVEGAALAALGVIAFVM